MCSVVPGRAPERLSKGARARNPYSAAKPISRSLGRLCRRLPMLCPAAILNRSPQAQSPINCAACVSRLDFIFGQPLRSALLRASRKMAACQTAPVAILRDGRPSFDKCSGGRPPLDEVRWFLFRPSDLISFIQSPHFVILPRQPLPPHRALPAVLRPRRAERHA
jgi:hypothetical protein